ncbi:MAG: putative glycoside hydrolase [Terriglobales bacterium]
MLFSKIFLPEGLLLAVAISAFGFASTSASRHPVPANAEIRAIYLTGPMAGSAHGRRLARQWRREGGNAVVFDIKDNSGPVSFNAAVPLASHMRRPYIASLPEWVNWLHQHGLYAIARMTVFQDGWLSQTHPELAVRSRSSGAVWEEHGNRYWMDPSQPAVQNYNIALAQAAAEAGVDEIQFDAIRFPVEGNQRDARFLYQSSQPNQPRAWFITNFLRRAQQALRPTGVRISVDVYGVMGWTQAVDLQATGQNVATLAKYCNVICPMIYPSHFFHHFDGYADPSAHPRHFIRAGMDKFEKLTRGENVIIRPWLQAFAWRTRSFSPGYIREQVEVEHAMHGGGFMMWNAGNRYQVLDQAMPGMSAAGSQFFSGGFPYAQTAADSSRGTAKPGPREIGRGRSTPEPRPPA